MLAWSFMLAWVPTLSSNSSMGVSHQWLVNGFSRFHLCIPHGFISEKKEQKHSIVPFARSFTPWVIWKCVHDHHSKKDWTNLMSKPLRWLHWSLLYLFVFVLGGCCSLGLLPSPSIPNYEYTIFSLRLLTCDPFWLHLLSSSFPLFEE